VLAKHEAHSRAQLTQPCRSNTSGGLDLLENEIRWAVVGSLETGAAGRTVGTVWSVVAGLSFWAIYAAAVITSVALLDLGRLARWVAALGLLCVPAAFLLYWRGFFFSFLWLIAWHAASAVLLWRAPRVTAHRQP
jgi:hypothetical protein